MNLVTNCPWCGSDGVYIGFDDIRNQCWRIQARAGRATVFENYQDEELEGRAAAERIAELLELARERCGGAQGQCIFGCGHRTINPNNIIMLLSRMIHGHASARERVNLVEAAI